MAEFWKILSETDVCKRLSIPSEYFERQMSPYLEGAGCEQNAGLELEVRDGSGAVWVFGCSVRRRGYAKPVISRGWCNFVRAKGLKVGDKMVFTLQLQDKAQARSKLKFRVAATRKIKIFGVHMDASIL